ncbi:MAG: FHA domain-containing protein [Bacteroidales bacterium]|nr:FHA domain-containing protein [Clostridium sp.]MCM1204621.1 FHA domain-containing protein [Bacteroidales bacterium]
MQQSYFRKEGMRNYLVIPCEGEVQGEYEWKLMQYHQVPFFLQYEMREINGKADICYRLKNDTTVKDTAAEASLKLLWLKNMAASIIGVLEMAEEYLLDSEKILWQTDKVFVEAGTGKLQFCYYPEGKGGQESPKTFLTELLQMIDKREEEAVLFVLRLYHLLTEPDCTIEKLIRFRQKEIEGKAETPEKTPKVEPAKDWEAEKTPEPADGEKSRLWAAGLQMIRKKTGIEEKRQKREKEPIEKILSGLIVFASGGNLLLAAGLLFNILPAGAVKFLFVDMGILIIFTVLYMQASKEETADEIMRAYFEDTEKNGRGETEINRQRQALPEQRITAPDGGGVFCLEPCIRDKYPAIRMEQESIVLGRMEGCCNYILSESGVSRMHAKLIKKPDGIYLLDLHSANGTYLNGERIESGRDYKLEEGDMVSFARSEFYVVPQQKKYAI